MTTLDLAAVRYPEIDDRPHEPGGGPDWQESYVLSWWDDNAGIGGFFRTGHETGRNVASALVGLVTADGLRYRRNLEDLPLTPGDRKDDAFAVAARGTGGVPPTMAAGAATDSAYTVRFGDGTRRFEIHDEDCELELDVDDFYPMYNYYAVTSGQEVGRQVGSDHYQVAGRVTGAVRVGGREFTVDGLGHRDHSWGDRKWSAVLAHRWLAGSFGPDLSFSLVTTLMPGGHMIRMGVVARDGEILPVRDSDVVAFIEPDGMSHRAGFGTGVLPDGESLRLDVEVVDGILITIRNLAVVEGIGRVTYGDRVGFCDLEMSNNPRQGTDPPPPCLRAVSADGLSQRAWPGEAGEAPQ